MKTSRIVTTVTIFLAVILQTSFISRALIIADALCGLRAVSSDVIGWTITSAISTVIGNTRATVETDRRTSC